MLDLIEADIAKHVPVLSKGQQMVIPLCHVVTEHLGVLLNEAVFRKSSYTG